ncbi:hypothetical protein BrevBR_01600 [Brevundimonas sp. BR2-1]|uniref:hypothetical protein n=1 Tax=Brevundimonas sp. BR2-1 TaxID=3031123 RepID=UPI003099D5AE
MKTCPAPTAREPHPEGMRAASLFDVTEDPFVRIRTEWDVIFQLRAMPISSIQVNIRACEFPPAKANGVSFLKIPVKPNAGD